MRRSSTLSEAATATVAALATLAALLASTGCAPPEQWAQQEEMASRVTIHRDAWGVPHVFAPTDAEAVFGFLYAQAEDNFWQIEDTYIHALGRAAEVYGEEKLADDVLNRALEIGRYSIEEYNRLPAETKALCVAAADGLNFYLARHPDFEPRLITWFEPWHVLAYARYVTYQLFVYGRTGLTAQDAVEALREVPEMEFAPAPESTPQAGRSAAPQPGASGPAPGEGSLDELREPAAGVESEPVGSNMWAIGPERSSSGNPLLFINPHQPFFGPGQWVEGHLYSEEGLHVSGATFFGSPTIGVGHNEDVAWSHTVNTPDIVDLYVEEFDHPENPQLYRYGSEYRGARVWIEGILVRTGDGMQNRLFEFVSTHHGPVVARREGKPLTVRMAMFQEGGQLAARAAMARAESVAGLGEAMSSLGVPMFNVVMADRHGDIAYVYNGAVPRRSLDFDWSRPVDGSDPATEWQGYHDWSELPRVDNPPAGYVQNCNATPFRATEEGNPDPGAFPPYMAPEDDNARSRISRRILESQAQFTFDDWSRLAWDTRVIEAETRIPELRAAIDDLALSDGGRAVALGAPLRVLEEWDGVSTVESEAMTLFFVWADTLYGWQQSSEEPERPLVAALETALAKLEDGFGSWRVPWGELNRLQRIHTSGNGSFDDARESLPIAGAPGPLGIVFNFYTRAQEGAKRRYGIAGHSFVSVVELAERPVAKSVLVFGESADPSSPHYFDQARLYAQRQFKPAWFEPDEVEANAVRSYHPGERVEGE